MVLLLQMIPNQKSKDANPCNILHKLGRFYKNQSFKYFHQDLNQFYRIDLLLVLM